MARAIEAGVRNIAPTAAGNAHFGEELRAAFVNRDFVRRISPGAGDAGEETCCAAADNRNLSRHLYHLESALRGVGA